MNGIDVSRSVLISGLPSAFLNDSAEDFAETIYELLERTFSVTRDAIDHLIRSPELEPDQSEFGCKCLVSFRSRVHRHRVIAQKSKLEAPTKIESIMEIPRDILESSEEVLEVTDEWAADKGIQVKEDKGSKSSSTERIASKTVVESAKKTPPSGKSNLDEYADDDEDVVLVEEDNMCAVEDPKAEKDAKKAEADKVTASEAQKKDNILSNDEEFYMLEHPPLSPIDIHRAHDFWDLPINWDGAPEFQWRTVNDDDEMQMLKIENIVLADMYNPWMYPVMLVACRMETNFPKLSFNEVGNFSFGTVDLYFSDDNTLVSCSLNYLVYMRTVRGRRAKFLLPHTKNVQRFGKSLEKRLGRVRAPTPGMCQLLLKPVPDKITEKEIRNAFPHQSITKIEFKRDALKQRCAILTFASAQHAIAAHCMSNFIVFEAEDGNDSIVTVLYPSGSGGSAIGIIANGWDIIGTTDRNWNGLMAGAHESVPGGPCTAHSQETYFAGHSGMAVPDWDKGENLLVAAEMKKQDGTSSKKEKRVEKKKKDSAPPKEKEGPKAPKTKQGPEHKSTEKGKPKGVEKREISGKPGEKRPSAHTLAGPSNKFLRGGGNHSYRGPNPSVSAGWRSGTNVQPLFSVRPNYTYNGPSGSANEFSYNGPYKKHEPYHGPENRFSSQVGGLKNPSSWRNDFGARGIQGQLNNNYREENFCLQPDLMLEERIREQREKMAYKEQMLRQQKLIDDLEKQLRAQTQLAGGGYIGSFEERPEAVAQNYPTGEGPRAPWNTPGLSANYNMKERVGQPW